MECSSSLEIDKPPSEIFSFLYEWENVPLWLSEFQRFEPLEGEEGELGSTSLIYLSIGSSTFRLYQQISEIEEGISLTTSWTCFLFAIDRKFRLKTVEERSSILSGNLQIQPRNIMGTLCLPFLSKFIRKRHKRNMSRLKVALEEVAMV